MIAAIHQPHYLPWPGFMDKMDQADVFIYLDTVDYKRNEWQNRNRIRTAWGWQWLTVPVVHNAGDKIRDIRIDGGRWQRKHLQAFMNHYRGAPFFGRCMPLLKERLYDRDWGCLADLNIATSELFREMMGITTRTLRASELDAREEPTLRLIDLCKAAGADTYLSGSCGRDYMKTEYFDEAGIRLIFQEFSPPVYTQAYEGFIPGLSTIDHLMNTGDGLLALLREGRNG
ncbi:MAG: WbqC family protein [Nitrospirae bacterium]|nr:WbqC family protein [Nitrospirota bacterium]MBI5694956.1 WbqC family protein [Nitrospirota bacterium]